MLECANFVARSMLAVCPSQISLDLFLSGVSSSSPSLRPINVSSEPAPKISERLDANCLRMLSIFAPEIYQAP